MAEQTDTQMGGLTRAALLEAGAHLWLAEELRVAASLLSDGVADPWLTAERLIEVANALHSEANKHQHDARPTLRVRGADAVDSRSHAASSVHRAHQLRRVASTVHDYARALRHGGSRGWVNVYGEGGITAVHPDIVPRLLALADTETAIARSRARPASRPGATDHAHVALNDPAHVALASRPVPMEAARGPVAHQTQVNLRRRLAAAGEALARDASLVADNAALLSPPPPDAAAFASEVLACGGEALNVRWEDMRGGGVGEHADVERWGSTIMPQHGGKWMGPSIRWRPRAADGMSSDEEEEEARQEEKARLSRRALRASVRLYHKWTPDSGVCVRCVERQVQQVPTLMAR